MRKLWATMNKRSPTTSRMIQALNNIAVIYHYQGEN